jgi:hypothetical protein
MDGRIVGWRWKVYRYQLASLNFKLAKCSFSTSIADTTMNAGTSSGPLSFFKDDQS